MGGARSAATPSAREHRTRRRRGSPPTPLCISAVRVPLRARVWLAEGKIGEMVRRIVERFDPEKIILFGSFASGSAGADSDVDLLVVMRVATSKRKRAAEIDMVLADVGVPKDVIVAGIHEAIAVRIATMVGRIPARDEIVLTGGVAHNAGVARILEEKLGHAITVPAQAQLAGAIGAALIARD